MTLELSLEEYQGRLRLTRRDGKVWVQCAVRKTAVVLTPEEHVRQLFIWYLVEAGGYPLGRLRAEWGLRVNELAKRCDLVAFGDAATARLLVECKAPHIALTAKVLQQLAGYNFALRVPYLLLTNGRQTLCYHIDYAAGLQTPLGEVPIYEALR